VAVQSGPVPGIDNGSTGRDDNASFILEELVRPSLRIVPILRSLALAAFCFGLIASCAPKKPAAQHFAIYFEPWSAQLDSGAKGTILAAAKRSTEQPDAPVVVTGFADPEGSPQANRDLSLLRAQVVTDGLGTAGIPQSRITRQAVGSVNYTVDSIESRRVEIIVGTP
jgi:outer membrane protein OmpA-like peptidoglycan-associated protein